MKGMYSFHPRKNEKTAWMKGAERNESRRYRAVSPATHLQHDRRRGKTVRSMAAVERHPGQPARAAWYP